MNTLATIGHQDTSIRYTDRVTVKIVITLADKILILNDGLLPGGGIEHGESAGDAITRELQEELGVTVNNVQKIGTVVQYRNFLGKKYIISGYSATLDSTGGDTDPQDVGEARFVQRWLNIDAAIAFVKESINTARNEPGVDDIDQGKLYNLITTYELLNTYKD